MDSDSDQEKHYRLWKIGPNEIESTETEFNVKSRAFGWKCTSMNDRGHMLLVQNDELPLVEHYIFDGYEIDSNIGSSELKSRASISGKYNYGWPISDVLRRKSPTFEHDFRRDC